MMTAFQTWRAGKGLRATLALLALVALPAAARAQATITGKVTAAGQPLVDARVLVRGTSLATNTNGAGEYTLRNVPAGTQSLEMLRVGYRAQNATVALTAGQSKEVNFTTEAAVIQLQEIVTTATGQQRRVELGNAIGGVGDVSKRVEESQVKNVADLLVAKAAGVSVLPGNETGSSAVVRIRGTNSLSLSNAPIYVVDGVRMISSSVGVATGGTTTSFINDLNPDDIEDIEIVKGPSAATLYGTDAANGVIVITTKKGRAGSTRWSYYGEKGVVSDRNNYADQYAVFGKNAAGTTTRCVLETIANKTCFPDSTSSFNPMKDPELSPVHSGHRDSYGANVSGGSDAVRFFVSGDMENEIGPIKMPAFARAFLDSIGDPAKDHEIYPEAFQRQTVRANLNAALSPTFDLGVNSAWTNRNQRLPQTDNNTVSIFATALKNPGFRPSAICRTNTAACLGYSPIGSLGEDLRGYANYMPSQTFQDKLWEGVQRFNGSVDANWRPYAWMQNSGSVGVDVASRSDWEMCKLSQCPNSGTTRQGFVSDQHSINRNFSAKFVSNGSWQAAQWANLKTTVGADYTNTMSEFTASSGTNLPPGAQNVGQAAVKSGSNQLQTANKTLGVYVQEQAGFRDRLFVTAAVRSDQNSAFGTKFQRVFYPKLSASYLISDESFFPKYQWLDQLRLRTAYGASGVQPGATTALQTFSAVTRTANATTPGNATGTDLPGLAMNALGNPNLKPETSAEWEGGFESRMFNNRATVDFTYYYKKTKDALIAQPIAASAAPSATTITGNFGSIMNKGVEAVVNLTVMDRRNFGWDMTWNGSHTTNKILSLGVDATGKPNPTIGTGTTRDSVGLPANGWFFKPYTYADKNGDGLIDDSEVTVGSSDQYMGYSQPRDILSIQNGFDLFGKKLRLTGLLDYKGGFSVYNQTVQFYCSNQPTCYEETNTSTPLWRQARVIAQRYTATKTQAGYLENGQFWRLREVSAILSLPQQLAARARAKDASLVFAARNLHIWTKYTGTDPESNYATGDVQTDFETAAPPSYFTVRLNLHF
ncbi:MAG TPA: SusC/RagA family TonB-linked outer membrane protein [Gemmatimonadaceae bacterium]|nr:SusC/RagA family TonB-linked outer membrane protein [Gemmatimonadaceae bacterium]